MSLSSRATVTALIEVIKWDSEWIPLTYRLIWLKQKDPQISEWAQEEVSLMPHNQGGILAPGMRIGDKRIYRVTFEMSCSADYWGEWDSCMKILKCHCIRKPRRK